MRNPLRKLIISSFIIAVCLNAVPTQANKTTHERKRKNTSSSIKKSTRSHNRNNQRLSLPDSNTRRGLSSCSSDQYKVDVSILSSKDRPEENSWRITSADGTVVGSNDGPFLVENTWYNQTLCLPIDDCYAFTMKDEFANDNFFGEFHIEVDGSSVLSSSNFPTNAIPYLANDNKIAGTQCSHSTPCAADEMTVDVTFITDYYYYENTFKIKSLVDGSVQHDPISFPNDFTVYRHRYCLDRSTCYAFSVHDDNGQGDFYGNYIISVDGIEQANSKDYAGGKYPTELDPAEFGDCTVMPSEVPSVAPSISTQPSIPCIDCSTTTPSEVTSAAPSRSTQPLIFCILFIMTVVNFI